MESWHRISRTTKSYDQNLYYIVIYILISNFTLFVRRITKIDTETYLNQKQYYMTLDINPTSEYPTYKLEQTQMYITDLKLIDKMEWLIILYTSSFLRNTSKVIVNSH